MFNSLKKLFGRRGGATVDTNGDFDQEAQAPVQQAPQARSVRVDAQPAQPSRSSPGTTPPSSVGVPLKSIIARLAPDLMQRVRQVDIGETEIFIPTQKVLTQISTGSVRISFGELRQLAPPGTFTPENDRDRTLIDLPLQEILARLNPSLFSRRPAQKQIDVPSDVVGPFGGQTKLTISNAPVKGNQAAGAPTRTRPVTAGPGIPAPMRAQPPQAVPPVQPAPRFQPEAAPLPPTPRIQGPATAPQPIFARIRPSAQTPPAQTPPPVKQPVAPAVPEVDEEPIFQAKNRFTPTPAAATPPPAPVQPTAPKLPPVFSPIAPDPEPEPVQSGDTEVIQMPEPFNQAPAAPAPITPIAPISEPEPEPIRFSAPPAAEPAMPVTTGETRFITVSIAELCENWAEAVRNEINANKLSNSWIGLPLSAVEGNIKSGKIAFPWKALRSWIKPPIPPAASPYDTTMLECPLKVVTPLFLAELKATRTQKRYSLDEAIPDLFFNSQPPEAVVVTPVVTAPPPAHVAPPAPVALPVLPTRPAAAPAPVQPVASAQPAHFSSGRPADTNYFVRKDAAQPEQEQEQEQEPEVFFKKGTNTPGTAFLNRYATPNEIVSKAATLDGVDGALIALPDGLLVASRIPTNMNADTIAAFLPQIFGRVSQCTRELRLGELNNLNFTVGNIPWKIFRVGSIYFAAFGRPGVPLPTSQLVGLAAELDRKAK